MLSTTSAAAVARGRLLAGHLACGTAAPATAAAARGGVGGVAGSLLSPTPSTSNNTTSPRTRSFSTTPRTPREIKNVTVFGAGLMGAGIAQVLAHRGGYSVTLADVTASALSNGQKIISASLARIAKKTQPLESEEARSAFVQRVLSSISTTTDAAAAVRESDLVIEAIIENVKIKQELFAFLDQKAPQETIFASNTSSLSITDIASTCRRKDRFGGFHAFNPVPQMKLVEVVRTKDTSEETFNALLDVAKRMGKTPVSCVDSPGFIVNRLLVPYMLEAIRLVERGEATPRDVDTAMKLGAGYPMGPFELADLVGLDTLQHISQGWRESRVQTGEIAEEIVKPTPLLEQLVQQGRLGKKSEKGGFYDN